MEFNAIRQEILSELQMMMGVIEKKHTMPILGNVWVKASENRLKLQATDLEVGMMTECPAQVIEEGEFTVNAKRLQEMLAATDQVGKVNALTDVVKVLNRELRDGDEADYRLPDSANAAAQLLIQFQSSHRPQDLWHLTTPDYRKTALWLQLSSGDNREMTRVLDSVDQYIAENPLPEGVTASWAGKTYINVVWQQAMVSGMLKSLLGAFAFVFFMMLFLFRSLRLAILAMIPLSATIIAIYGLIGWVGKDYDMPIAVLSSLTLGLSVDFAIHFIERFRSLLKSEGSFSAAAREIFEEPGRAIARNAFVIALGFTPLFLAPLVPYITVGAFMTSVMAISGLSTLVLLPAVIGAFRGTAFPGVIRESTESTVTNSSLGETP